MRFSFFISLVPNVELLDFLQPNPFGAARPREQVIAERTGKKEQEVLKEQAAKEWKKNVNIALSFYVSFSRIICPWKCAWLRIS
jgi:hypothetical protein